MSLLKQIQVDILDDQIQVGNILLKLRFLASKLDLLILEEWVQHEIEGYPKDANIPSYRIAPVSYTTTISNGYTQYPNMPIAPAVIEQFASKEWLEYKFREELAVIESLKKQAESGHGSLGPDPRDLQLLLQDKIYQGFSILEIRPRLGIQSLVRIQNAVRTKTQGYVLELEKQVPAIADFTVREMGSIEQEDKEKANNLTQEIYYQDVYNINMGSESSVNLNVIKGDKQSLINTLQKVGIPSPEAKELADIVQQESTLANKNNLGKQTKDWLKKKFDSGVAEAWGIGKHVVIDALKQHLGG